jgi:hypothetical protein
MECRDLIRPLQKMWKSILRPCNITCLQLVLFQTHSPTSNCVTGAINTYILQLKQSILVLKLLMSTYQLSLNGKHLDSLEYWNQIFYRNYCLHYNLDIITESCLSCITASVFNKRLLFTPRQPLYQT